MYKKDGFMRYQWNNHQGGITVFKWFKDLKIGNNCFLVLERRF